MDQGWIKLHRQIQDNFLWKEKRVLSKAEAWIDLLLLASHKPSTIFVRNIPIQLQPGDLFWSQEQLSKRWSWSRKKTKNFLNLLQTCAQLNYKVDNKIGIISIANWAKYQEKDTTKDTTKDHQKIIRGYNKGYPNKNVKNVKNVKKDASSVKVLRTFDWFKAHRGEILERAGRKFPDLDVDKAFIVFIEQIEAKGYKYINHEAAYHSWLRSNLNNQFSK